MLTRDNDTGIGPCVDVRGRAGERAGADAVVSIHADGAAPGGHGFHVAYSDPPLNAAQLELVLNEIGAAAPARLAAFHETGELDTAYQQPGLPRFRVNAFRQRGHVSIALRVIPYQVRTIDDLGLPEVIRKLAS